MSQQAKPTGSPCTPSTVLVEPNWQPEPLVPELPDGAVKHPQHVVSSKPGKYMTVDGVVCLNLGTHNYLGLAEDKRLEESSIQATFKYGVGSCGPRAFYGTMDVHLKLEEELTKFLRLEETVLYSFGFSTIASAIPAYVRHKDTLVFVDEFCNFAIQQGLNAARCQTVSFKHNDCADLERKIQAVHSGEHKVQGNPKKLRLFLIVEGVSARTGRLCPLKALVELKRKHKIRLFLDESCSFGVLGATGRGITEHFGVDAAEVDMVMGSLENALCAFGGFCAGSAYLMDHQRLAGSGYCFSASLPPLQAQAALESLLLVQRNPELVRQAQAVFAYAHERLAGLSRLRNLSDELSPVKVLVLRRDESSGPVDQRRDEQLLRDMCECILEREHMALPLARYLDDEEFARPVPSVRLCANAYLTRADVDRVVAVLESYSPSV